MTAIDRDGAGARLRPMWYGSSTAAATVQTPITASGAYRRSLSTYREAIQTIVTTTAIA